MEHAQSVKIVKRFPSPGRTNLDAPFVLLPHKMSQKRGSSSHGQFFCSGMNIFVKYTRSELPNGVSGPWIVSGNRDPGKMINDRGVRGSVGLWGLESRECGGTLAVTDGGLGTMHDLGQMGGGVAFGIGVRRPHPGEELPHRRLA